MQVVVRLPGRLRPNVEVRLVGNVWAYVSCPEHAAKTDRQGLSVDEQHRSKFVMQVWGNRSTVFSHLHSSREYIFKSDS